MTILDDRVGIGRLAPTPLSILRDAIDRIEGDLDELRWDVYNHADADTFKGLGVDSFPLKFKGQSREMIEEHLDDTRHQIACDVNLAGSKLHDAVLAALRKLADNMEGELIRLHL